MKQDKLRLAKNFTSLLILRGLDFLLPIITVPYLLRVIGIEGYGLVSFAYAFALYSAAITQYGFNITATREIARNRDNLIEVRRIYTSAIYTTITLSIVAITLSVVAALSIEPLKAHWNLVALSLLQTTAQSIFPIWFFQGMERMSYITYLHAAAKLITLTGILTIINEPVDYVYIPAINAAGQMIILIGALWIVSRKFNVKLQKPKTGDVMKMLKSGRHAFTSQLAPTLYNNSTVFLLGLFAGSGATGIYSAATKVIDAANSLAYVASSAALPQLSRSLDFHSKFKRGMLLTGLTGTVFLIATAAPIGQFLHPVHGEQIADTIRLISVSVFLTFALLTFGANYLMLVNKEHVAAKLTLYTSLIFFLSALYLVPTFGLNGAIITLVGARSVMAVAYYAAYRRLIRTKRQELS